MLVLLPSFGCWLASGLYFGGCLFCCSLLGWFLLLLLCFSWWALVGPLFGLVLLAAGLFLVLELGFSGAFVCLLFFFSIFLPLLGGFLVFAGVVGVFDSGISGPFVSVVGFGWSVSVSLLFLFWFLSLLVGLLVWASPAVAVFLGFWDLCCLGWFSVGGSAVVWLVQVLAALCYFRFAGPSFY